MEYLQGFKLQKLVVGKILILIFLILAPFGFFNIQSDEVIEINPQNASYYQENSCKFSLFDIYSQNIDSYNTEFLYNPSGEIECFGKTSWYEYEPAKLIENGWSEFEEEKLKIWFSTNLNIDLILQSVFWLILISFIPRHTNKVNLMNYIAMFVNIAIFYLHIVGESEYYRSQSRQYDISFLSREFNGDLYYENYFLYIFLISLFVLNYLIIRLFEYRFQNLINFIPFMFIIYGTYASLNLNIYIIIFSFFGILSILKKQINFKFTFIYFSFGLFWLVNLDSKVLNFDVDKLRGFINSSQTMPSLFYWIFVYYLVLTGCVFLINESKQYFNLRVFRRNLIISGSLISFFGWIATTNQIFNFSTFYYLGLNKFGMKNLESISGNTWRGLSATAEGVGEFFGFIILFTILFSHYKKVKLTNLEVVLSLLIIYGLFRANNFAAISSCLVLFYIYFGLNYMKTKKNFVLMSLIIIFLGSFIYTQFFREFSYQYLSSNILYEGVQATEFEFDLDKNQFGETQAEQANYQYVLQIPENEANISTSLRFLLENYTYGYNIKNVPSLISTVNVASYYINRSEKWGIFFAKYNPDLKTFLFGYGPQQFTSFYLEHPTKYNYGLFLPHSSVLNYLIFFGLVGLSILFLLISKILILSKKDGLSNYLIIFFLLNFIKSDALLYLPNLILFVLILNFYKIEDLKSEI